MKMLRLDELFEVRNGLASQEVVRSPRRLNENWVPYIRPSFRQDTSIDAYVNKFLVPSDCLYPKDTLYVSPTDKAATHTVMFPFQNLYQTPMSLFLFHLLKCRWTRNCIMRSVLQKTVSNFLMVESLKGIN